MAAATSAAAAISAAAVTLAAAAAIFEPSGLGVFPMSVFRCSALIPLAVVLCLGSSTATVAREHDLAHWPPGVADHNGIFGESARAKATAIAEDIGSHTGKTLRIDVWNDWSPTALQEYRALRTSAERKRFMRKYAEERAAQGNVDGVYVLLCSDHSEETPARHLLHTFLPKVAESGGVLGHVVVVYPPENDSLFPESDREQLDSFFAGLRTNDSKRDRTLLEAVEFARSEMIANARGVPGIARFLWTDALWAAAVLLTIWVALGLFRARVLARQGASVTVPVGADQALAAMYSLSAALWLLETIRARPEANTTPPVPQVADRKSSPSEEGLMHRDDLAALKHPPGLWGVEGSEATTGHDLS
jgi:hypothetical protein